MKCAIFDCKLLGFKILLGDDKKPIYLCEKHYEVADQAIKNRFKK